MSYIRKVSRADREKWMKRIDELLDIEFEKTIEKIRNDIEEKSTSAIKKIKLGKIKRDKFVVSGYINFLNLRSATLPIIMNEELTWAYVEASGRWTDDLMAFNAFSKKYDLYVFSSKNTEYIFMLLSFIKEKWTVFLQTIFLQKLAKNFAIA